MKTLYIPLLLVLIFVGSCVNAKYSALSGDKKMIKVNEPVYEMKAVRLSDSTVRISFVGSPTVRTPGRNVAWVEAAVGPDENSLMDTIVFATSTAGAPGSTETITLIGEATWDTKAAKMSKRCVMDVSVVTALEHIMYQMTSEYVEADPMDLTPFIQPRSDSLVDIGVIARRVFIPPGEHLPSSENLRIIITDKSGQVIYRSDYQQNFLSIVTVLEPQISNQMQRYAAPWNGKNLQGNQVESGTYNAEIIIPARPKAYVARTELSWPPK